MKIELIRYSDNGDDTLGLLFIDGFFQCYTLEDEFRNVKVAGETRIPAGDYEIGFRESDSPMTDKYRKIYPDFFDYHIHIKDVPNFQFVYIHHGNDDDDTDGCILLGDSAQSNTVGQGKIGYSRNAFTKFYKKVWKALKSGEKVSITIIDFDKGIKLN